MIASVTREVALKLTELTASIKHEAGHWRAIHFRFSQLLEQYRSDYQIQIAVNLVSDVLFSHQGNLFVYPDHTLVLLCRDAARSQLEKAIFQLRYLFMDDPLAYTPNGDENPEFCQIYDLGVDYDIFTQWGRRKLAQADRHLYDAPDALPPPAAAPDLALKSFTPSRLAHIEHDLNKADLSRLIRRQPICAMMGENAVRRVFDEHYIHINHLRQMLRTEMDFFSNRHLFRYLTQLLDERMLDVLTLTPMRFFDTAVSFNFNIETILSPKFRTFDASMRASVKVSIIIELQVGDVFGDMAAFFAARNLLQTLNYKLCLDGLTTLILPHLDREKLGFDLMKLQWNADAEHMLKSKENQPLVQAINECGQSRIILSRCDSRQAVAYGQALGIQLFQGRFIDRIINPNIKVEN